MSDGYEPIRRLKAAAKKVADKHNVDITEMGAYVDPQEIIRIAFVARPEAIETEQEREVRETGDAFDALVGGQEFGFEEEEAKEKEREKRKDVYKSVRELLDDMGEDDD